MCIVYTLCCCCCVVMSPTRRTPKFYHTPRDFARGIVNKIRSLRHLTRVEFERRWRAFARRFRAAVRAAGALSRGALSRFRAAGARRAAAGAPCALRAFARCASRAAVCARRGRQFVFSGGSLSARQSAARPFDFPSTLKGQFFKVPPEKSKCRPCYESAARTHARAGSTRRRALFAPRKVGSLSTLRRKCNGV